MSEPAIFARWEDWQTECQRRGLEGPYQIATDEQMWQYVRPNRGGTAALWNYKNHRGFVFNDRATSETGEKP